MTHGATRFIAELQASWRRLAKAPMMSLLPQRAIKAALARRGYHVTASAQPLRAAAGGWTGEATVTRPRALA